MRICNLLDKNFSKFPLSYFKASTSKNITRNFTRLEMRLLPSRSYSSRSDVFTNVSSGDTRKTEIHVFHRRRPPRFLPDAKFFVPAFSLFLPFSRSPFVSAHAPFTLHPLSRGTLARDTRVHTYKNHPSVSITRKHTHARFKVLLIIASSINYRHICLRQRSLHRQVIHEKYSRNTHLPSRLSLLFSVFWLPLFLLFFFYFLFFSSHLRMLIIISFATDANDTNVAAFSFQTHIFFATSSSYDRSRDDRRLFLVR